MTSEQEKQPGLKEEIASLKTSKLEKLWYGFGDFGNNIILMFVASFLTLYYTDSVGLSAAYIGTMMLVARVFDGLSDIIMGFIIDKTNTRWGKARPWILFMALPFAISVILLFNVPSGAGEGFRKAYIFLTYVFLTVVCNTALNISYLALLPRFSLTSQDRSTATVVRSIFATVASLGVAMLTPAVIARLGGERNQGAWTILSVVYAAIAFVFLLIAFFGVKEKIPTQGTVSKTEKVEMYSLGSSLKIVLSNRYFYIVVLLFVTFFVTNGNSAVGIYYARDVLGNAQLYSLISLVGVLPLLIGMPFMPLFFRKFGKKNTMMAAIVISAAACIVGMANPRNILVYMGVVFLRGIGTAALSTAIYTLAGDIVDYNEWKTGIRTEGITTSANSFGIKLGTGLGSAILGWSLAWGHYDASLAVQPDSAINSMIVTALGIPLGVYVLCFIMLIFWDLEKYQSQVIPYISGKYKSGAKND
jgi:GPH family glycoside/pentoside/hexuronide:cation symporter